MKLVYAIVAAAGLNLMSAPANAEVLDLSTMSCRQFIDSGPDAIKMARYVNEEPQRCQLIHLVVSVSCGMKCNAIQ
jgi:hypothetical protein